LFLARGPSSSLIAFRDDVSQATVELCRRIVTGLPLWDGSPAESSVYAELTSVLAIDRSITEQSHGPAFTFGGRVATDPDITVTRIDGASAALLDRFFPYTRSILGDRRPVVGVVVGDAVVSACYSARRGPRACEAGVDTEEPFRGRGYGAAVVVAWRAAVEEEGRVPLYSTSWDNAASLALARKLGLVAYADTLSLT
jgi:GNAT superfamily N-acetyltransferase